jgi:ubiquinone/menaquinone biosynthesis C-methylase UbiE
MKKGDGHSPSIEAVKETFDESVHSYSAQIEDAFGPLSDSHDFFIQHKTYMIRELLVKRLPDQNVRILDVGCGMGLTHKYLDDNAIELHGIDISPKSIEFSTKHNPHAAYHLHDGDRLPFGDNEFDLVFASGVLHHVPVHLRQGFIKEMVRVVRSGKFVMVIEHNPLNPGTRWVVNNCELDKDAVLLASWKLKQLYREANLSAIKTRNILFTPFKAPIFRRLDQWFSRIPFGAQYVIEATKTKNLPGNIQ